MLPQWSRSKDLLAPPLTLRALPFHEAMAAFPNRGAAQLFQGAQGFGGVLRGERRVGDPTGRLMESALRMRLMAPFRRLMRLRVLTSCMRLSDGHTLHSRTLRRRISARKTLRYVSNREALAHNPHQKSLTSDCASSSCATSVTPASSANLTTVTG